MTDEFNQLPLKQNHMETENNRQCDSLFEGKLICRQPKEGYRFSVDSVLLAHFLEIRTKETILDLGTGCGIISLILCYRNKTKHFSVTGIEKQHNLAELARSNIAENNFKSMVHLIHDDVRNYKRIFSPESYSLVVSNPPYYARGSGRLNDNTEALAARHQDDFGISGFVDAAAFCVKNRGRVIFIFPAELSITLIDCFQRCRLTPKIIQYIYSYPESTTASLVIIEALKNGGVGCRVREPYYLYQYKNGPYSNHAASMYAV